jgi:hypothetical protein
MAEPSKAVALEHADRAEVHRTGGRLDAQQAVLAEGPFEAQRHGARRDAAAAVLLADAVAEVGTVEVRALDVG